MCSSISNGPSAVLGEQHQNLSLKTHSFGEMAQPERRHWPCKPDDLILIPGNRVDLGSSSDRLQLDVVMYAHKPRTQEAEARGLQV